MRRLKKTATLSFSESRNARKPSPLGERPEISAWTKTKADSFPVTTREKEQYIDNSHGYFVKLTLHSGHGLAIRDRNGTSDPYVKVRHANYRNRTSTVYKNLNPIWNEEFGFKLRDLFDPVVLKVYDEDVVTSDDFMGRGFVALNRAEGEMGSPVSLQIKLHDDKNKGEELGYLQVTLLITCIRDHTLDQQLPTTELTMKLGKKRHKYWKSIVSITLLEGKGLPSMDQNGYSDPYCKFKLGSQKYRSNVQHKTLNPEWKEHFELKLFEGESRTLHISVMDKDYLSSDDFIGSCKVDLDQLEVQRGHDLLLPLVGGAGSIRLILVISGIPAEEGEESNVAMETAWSQYSIEKSFRLSKMNDVGLLKITVLQAEGLNDVSSNCNLFCTVEVGQARLRTNTLYIDSNPTWNKTFYFHIKDIHNSVHLVLYNDLKNKDDLIGQVVIPLLKVESGVTKGYQLKDKDYHNRAFGTVVVNCELVYNHFRAAVRTVNPKETSILEQEPQFQQKVLRYNVNRILAFARPLIRSMRLVDDILSWKDRVLSSLTIVMYLLVCYFIELWMVFVCVIFVVVALYAISHKPHIVNAEMRTRIAKSFKPDNDSESESSDLDDHIEEDESKDKKSFREKLRQVMGLLLLVQVYTGHIADGCERFKNLVCWSVPFLCWLIIMACVMASLVTYFVPLRFIIMIWGLNKLTKKLRKPNAIPNQELLDFLSRSPTDLELAKWKEL